MLNGASYNDPRKFLQTHEYENLMRWTREIGERAAVKRGRMVNRTSGPPGATSDLAPLSGRKRTFEHALLKNDL